MDDDNSKSLDKYEFKKAIRDFKVDIPEDYVEIIFNAFDLNRDGTIDYDEFVRIIRGDLTPPRLALVKKAYAKLDKDGSGIVDIDDIRDVYNTSRHPDVMAGKKTSDQVLVEFLETFEMHHSIQNGNKADGRVTLDEFIEYYTNISASLDNDEYFAIMMNNSWNLSGDSSPYKKYEKGWTNQSPDKANAFAG
jgi:Ca2+-binding EF-hand superfamily protein